MASDKPRLITRRDILTGVGTVAASAAAGAALPSTHPAAAAPPPAVQSALAQTAAVARAPLETLTAQEADLLDHIVARLIPSDALGPGAREAQAVRYIDRALGGALASSRDAYRSGLAAFDRYCQMSRGKPFAELTAGEQDAVLIDMETGAATASGFAGSSAQFFALMLNHTRQGTFGDPYYGGNADFVGWDLLGYPGVRTAVSAADQQALERNQLKPDHRSAYDTEMFNKATAAVSHGSTIHGD